MAFIVTLVFVLLIWFYNAPKEYNWQVYLRPNGSEPYDTEVLYKLLQNVRDNQVFYTIEDSLEIRLQDSSEAVDNYVFLGDDLYIDSLEISTLIEFVENGNNIFFFSSIPTNPLLYELVKKKNEDIYLNEHEYDSNSLVSRYMWETTDTNTISNIANNSFHYSHYRNFEKSHYDYHYFYDSLFVKDSVYMEVLGTYTRPDDFGGEEMEYPEFIRFKYGKGFIYFHSNPVRFTNYYCINDSLTPYVQAVFAHLGQGKVIWDEESRHYEYNNADHSPQLPNEGPLEFILSEPSLRRAWYLLLAGIILYLAFGAKRKQRIIPVTENMENTSIEYAETISQLFMKQQDHSKLVKLKIELFKAFVRERLNIYVPVHLEQWDDGFTRTIAQRSGVRTELIALLVGQCKKYDVPTSVETENMLEFHNNLEEFYFYCK
jgi:hypothetical protein